MSGNRLDGKIAIITGGASGIGAETARLFTNHGAKVVIVDIQQELGLNVVASIGKDKASYYKCDVTNETEVENVVKFTIEKYGKLDILFSNAGVMETLGETILELNLEQFDRIIAINVRGAAAFIKHAARAMVANKTRGSIVCTTSVAAEIGGQGSGYTTSKHGLVGMIKSACGDLGKYGIRVNGIAPFGVATGMTSRDEETARMVEGYCEAKGNLKGVVLKTSHVAQAALFLASDDSVYVSGQNLVVDGGFSVVKSI